MARPRKHLRPLPDQAAQELKTAILQGRLKEGDRLHQVALAKQLGLSPIPLREALRQLENEGFVTLEPYHGAVVRKTTPEELVDLTETRLVLEALALRSAMPHLTPGMVDEAIAQRDRMVAAKDPHEVHEAHLTLLDILYAPAERPHLLHLLRDVVSRAQRYYPIYKQVLGTLPEELPTLLEYLQACRDRDLDKAHLLLETRMRATTEACCIWLRARAAEA
ncbi:MAG TPA: GntR family transcriptional regulator [Holophagaceae bacterium]|nr:GntR family transcriptional regulator [Holophagaceae bacterium]